MAADRPCRIEDVHIDTFTNMAGGRYERVTCANCGTTESPVSVPSLEWLQQHTADRQDDVPTVDDVRERQTADHAALASLRAERWLPLNVLTNADALAAFKALCTGRLWEPSEADEIVKWARMTQRIDRKGEPDA